MDSPRMPDFDRRAFLARACALGAGSLLGLHNGSASAEPALETKRIRFIHAPSICIAPQYLAEELLRLPKWNTSPWERETVHTPSPKVARTSGCYELFGNDRVRAIRDLKGKTVAIQ